MNYSNSLLSQNVRRTCKSFNWAILLVTVFAFCFLLSSQTTSAQALKGLGSATLLSPLNSDDAKVKNVLFIVADDLKASVLGCYGMRGCKTPNIDRLAKQGTVFQRAYCQGTWCAPSRQSFMFSRYQSGGEVSMGQNFREHGFYSARVGKIFHMRVPGDIIAGTNGSDDKDSWTERFNSTGQEAHTPGEYACLNLNVFTNSLVNRQSTQMPHRPYVTVEQDGDGSDQPDFKSAQKAIEILRQRKSNSEPFLDLGNRFQAKTEWENRSTIRKECGPATMLQ
jgi:iduronate 2-sulfatase